MGVLELQQAARSRRQLSSAFTGRLGTCEEEAVAGWRIVLMSGLYLPYRSSA